jgi:hypothetical protein
VSTTQITFTFRVNGTLTNVTSVVLADPTATYGVRRTDTSATVVAANTALTNQSTGVYTYSFTDPAGGLTYNYHLKWVYNGVTYYQERNQNGEGASSALTDAITKVRYYARSAGSSTAYTDAEITDAIQTVCDEFIRITKCTKRVDTISLTAAAAGVLPTLPTGFRPDRLISAYLTGSNVVSSSSGYYNPIYGEGRRDGWGPPYSATLGVIPYQQLIEMKYTGAVTGQPQYLAFSSGVVESAAGEVFPVPGETYTANLLWFKAFSTADSTWVIADDYLSQILSRGVPAFLQRTEPEATYAVREWAEYQNWVREVATAGNLGATEVISSPRRR